MILAIDMGNTNIVVGCIDNEKLYCIERIATEKNKTYFDYAMCFKTVLELNSIDAAEIDGVILSSVVPQLTDVIKKAAKKITGLEPIIVGPGVKTGLNILMENPRQVGTDLIVDAVAAIESYDSPLIIIDLGTAITMSVIDKNRNYIGGSILSGLKLSMEALSNNASQLFNISLEPPKHIIGKNTIDSMKSGIIIGNAACIDGMIDRFEEELGYSTTVIATGGFANLIIPLCKHEIIIDEELPIKGLLSIYNKNRLD